MKNKPFLGRRGSLMYIGSVVLVQSYWVLEIYANFAYFNGHNRNLFTATRPYEALFRYPTSSSCPPWPSLSLTNLIIVIRGGYLPLPISSGIFVIDMSLVSSKSYRLLLVLAFCFSV